MNARSITRLVLLAVVALAVGTWAMKEFTPAKAITPGAETAATLGLIRPDGLTVINFHGEKRCRTCIAIGNLARKTIDEDFPEALKAGKLHWEVVNYDQPAEAHFVKDYQLVSSTVVLTTWQGGKEIKWNRLDAVWDHVGDEPAFRDYLGQNIRTLLNPR